MDPPLGCQRTAQGEGRAAASNEPLRSSSESDIVVVFNVFKSRVPRWSVFFRCNVCGARQEEFRRTATTTAAGGPTATAAGAAPHAERQQLKEPSSS
jgi:hypothetical protein